MQKRQHIEAHPMVIFWLGVLTGAIVVGLVFFYRILSPVDFESSLLRFYYSPYRYSTLGTQGIGTPDGNKAIDAYSIGTPDGNKPIDAYSIGTPDGN